MYCLLACSFCFQVLFNILNLCAFRYICGWLRCSFFTKDNVDFKLISLDVRGIRSATKRKALLLWLNKQKADIVFLQETYCTKEVEPVCNTQWKGKMFYSHGTNHSCGVLVLVRCDLEYTLFQNGGGAANTGTSCMKARLRGPTFE